MRTIDIPNLNPPIHVALLNDACRWRAETFFVKEPSTVGWLGTLTKDDILWDVGANIALYSLFAASRGARVIAIEPMIANLFAIQQNLLLNPELASRITVAPLALSDVDGFADLHLSSPDIGSSCHTAGDSVNFKLEPKQHWAGKQGTILMRGEALGAFVPRPTALKLDCDGLEHKVIAGLGTGKLLAGIRTFIIEVNWTLEKHREMVQFLASVGFSYDWNQYAAAQRKEGAFLDVGEMVLTRDDKNAQTEQIPHVPFVGEHENAMLKS